jgi:predicted secreted protein
MAAGAPRGILLHPGSRTFMNRLILHLTLSTACILAACNREREPPVSDPAEPIRAEVGKEFQISVRENQSTGYSWHLVDSASRAPLVLVDSGFWISRANQRADGGGGTRSWTFLSRQAGSATVSMVHVPPSGSVQEMGDTTRYRVVIE